VRAIIASLLQSSRLSCAALCVLAPLQCTTPLPGSWEGRLGMQGSSQACQISLG